MFIEDFLSLRVSTIYIVLENMSKIINFSLGYHSIGLSALVIGSVTEKCPIRNHNKIADISEILQGRKITMADFCNLG